MGFFEPMWIAVGTYSVLPAPHVPWNERNTRLSICFLPFVGLFVAALSFLWMWGAKMLAVDSVLFASVAAVLPLLLTGGIHMDGFLDTVDALASHKPREEKLAILKDPHVGAFAVLFCGAYLLVSFGLYHALFRSEALFAVCPGFVLSRAAAAGGALTLPKARKGGMLYTLVGTDHTRISAAAMAAAALLAAGGMCFLSPAGGGIAGGLCLVVFFSYRAVAMGQFGGATGDTTGFFLQACELALLFGVWVGGLL